MKNISNYKKEDCCGCSSCISICPKACISFSNDLEGFNYPVIDENRCINCGLCIKSCPIIFRDTSEINSLFNQKIYAIKNKDIKTLKLSSSGGVFHELASFIIDKGGVVFGVKYDENFNVVYSKARTIDECMQFRGSKYVQSSIDSTYIEIKSELEKNKLVLFTGTPCYVEGLKLFLKKDYENLYTCDLLCHGTPSPKMFKEYIKFIEGKNKSKIESINMKDKKNGWEKSIINIKFKNGKCISNTKEAKLWISLFFKHLATRPSCHKCRFTNFQRASDITIGDYWGINKFHPEFYERYGVSLMMINSHKGDYIFNNVKNKFNYILSDKDKCIQQSLYKSATPSKRRENFWKDYNENSFKYIAKKYLNYNLISILKSKINNCLKKLNI